MAALHAIPQSRTEEAIEFLVNKGFSRKKAELILETYQANMKYIEELRLKALKPIDNTP